MNIRRKHLENQWNNKKNNNEKKILNKKWTKIN